MTDRPFDPEVATLLDEIAADPDASLLRMPKRPLKHWIMAPDEVVSPHGSHLTKAERHLAQTYREEAAWVLLESSVTASQRSLWIYTTLENDEAALARRAERLRGNAHLDAAAARTLGDLVEAGHLPAVRLATAALRLWPSDFGRLCLGLGLVAEEAPQAAFHLFETLTTARTLASTRAQAFENQAMILTREQRFEEAQERNEQALATDGTRLRFLFFCLTGSIQAGLESKAFEYARRIEAIGSSAAMDEVLADLSHQRILGTWEPSAAARPLVERLETRVPEQAGRILDAFR